VAQQVHLLVVQEAAGDAGAAIFRRVQVVEPRRQRHHRLRQPRVEPVDQRLLPVQALHLPTAQADQQQERRDAEQGRPEGGPEAAA
jgi:hypothetical protein